MNLTKEKCLNAYCKLEKLEWENTKCDKYSMVIEELIFEYFKLKREYESEKAVEKLCREVERFCTNETYFGVIVKAISMCEDKELVDNAIHCLAYLKKQLENPTLKFEHLEEE